MTHPPQGNSGWSAKTIIEARAIIERLLQATREDAWAIPLKATEHAAFEAWVAQNHPTTEDYIAATREALGATGGTDTR
jgi:hypothetical protein